VETEPKAAAPHLDSTDFFFTKKLHANSYLNNTDFLNRRIAYGPTGISHSGKLFRKPYPVGFAF